MKRVTNQIMKESFHSKIISIDRTFSYSITNSNIVCSCMLCFEFVDLMRAYTRDFRRFAEVFPSVDRKHHAAP